MRATAITPLSSPALLDEHTFERLQALQSRSPLRGRHATANMQNVLSGLARCPKCDSTMTRVNKGNPKKGGRPFLVCTKAKIGAGCEYHGVKLDEIESALLKDHERILRDMPHPDAHVEKQLRSAQAAVDHLSSRMRELLDLIEHRPSDALAKRIAALEVSVKAAEAERDAVAEKAAQSERRVVELKANALSVAMRARPVSRERINAALRELLDSVVVDYASGYLTFRWRAGGESSVMYAWVK